MKDRSGKPKPESGSWIRVVPLSAFRFSLFFLLFASPTYAQFDRVPAQQPLRPGYGDQGLPAEAPAPPANLPAGYAEPRELAPRMVVPASATVAAAPTPTPAAPASGALALPPAKPLALQLPEESARGGAAPRGGLPSIASVLGSLAIVVGLLLLMAWCIKRAAPKAAQQLPAGVVEVLGRTALAPRQNIHLVRVGNKMLLVAVSAGGAETLTEISDPLEVDRLAGLCAQAQPNSSSQVFRQVFQQFGAKSSAAESSRPAARRPLGRTYEGSDA